MTEAKSKLDPLDVPTRLAELAVGTEIVPVVALQGAAAKAAVPAGV